MSKFVFPINLRMTLIVLLNCEGKLRNFERVNCMMFGKSQFCQLDSQKIFPEIAYIDAVLVKVKK